MHLHLKEAARCEPQLVGALSGTGGNGDGEKPTGQLCTELWGTIGVGKGGKKGKIKCKQDLCFYHFTD